MPNIEALEVPVELRLELSAVVGLYHVHAEWQAAEDFVDELNGGALVARQATVWALAALALAATLAAAALGSFISARRRPWRDRCGCRFRSLMARRWLFWNSRLTGRASCSV